MLIEFIVQLAYFLYSAKIEIIQVAGFVVSFTLIGFRLVDILSSLQKIKNCAINFSFWHSFVDFF